MRFLAGLFALGMSLLTAQALEIGMVWYLLGTAQTSRDMLADWGCCRAAGSIARQLTILCRYVRLAANSRAHNTDNLPGMYSRSTWGGDTDPFILVKFLNSSVSGADDPIASLIIFEWSDRQFVGIPNPEGMGNVSRALSKCLCVHR